jgi:hypothetical protein
MKTMLAALPLLCLASCITEEEETVSWVSTEPRDHDPLRPLGSDGVDVQFMAMCIDERAAVSPWLGSEGSADSAASEHEGKRRGHRCEVVWRQKPGAGVPK